MDHRNRNHPDPREGSRPPEVVLHEERLSVDREPRHAGTISFTKSVESDSGIAYVPRTAEDADIEREPAAEGDSGAVETLEDGSISIPVLEEEIVVTKRVVVRERIIVRKRTVTEDVPIEAELRRERVSVEGPDDALDEQSRG